MLSVNQMDVQLDFVQQQPRRTGLQFYVIGKALGLQFSVEVYIDDDDRGINRVTDVQMRSGDIGALPGSSLWIDFCEQLAIELSSNQPQRVNFYDHWADDR